MSDPVISVILVNWNAAKWIPRCVESLKQQTIFPRLEIIFADNASGDGSEQVARDCLAGWTNAQVVQTGDNYGFAGGANRATVHARGRYLFIPNPDTWLEPNCLEELLTAIEREGATAAGAVICEYDDDTRQCHADIAFDIFGYPVGAPLEADPPYPVSTGSFSFIRADDFRRLGMYDDTTFMYSEEFDLGWRILLAGGKIIRVPAAKIHHRGEAAVNPAGGTKRVEFRTSERKRFYANRNHLLMLLKYPQHILFVMFLANVALLSGEAVFWLVTKRRWSLVRESFLRPLAECWRMRGHVAQKRRALRAFRQHGDFWMLRHLSWRFGRWPEVRRIMKLGMPKV